MSKSILPHTIQVPGQLSEQETTLHRPLEMPHPLLSMHRLQFSVILCVAFLLSPLAQAGTEKLFLQALVTHHPLETSTAPPALMATVSWEYWRPASGEKAPLAGLRLLTRESRGALWLGSSQGLIRFDPKQTHPWERWRYFAGRRWLQDDQVENASFVEATSSASARVWVRTKTGITEINFQPMTLGQKARHYEESIESRHSRHGMVAGSRLQTPGDLRTSIPVDNDNDGLWTAMYMAAQCYRYAVTRETEAREKARRSLDLLMRLEQITGIPGFPARSFLSIKEPAPRDGEWHTTSDGQWLWKGDTSSDEIVGHFYGYSLYYDLVASGAEREAIRQVVARLMDHIISHDFQLIDLDGKPTRWGRWNETYFRTEHGNHDSALNALELLSFLRTSLHITGDPRYEEVFQERVKKGYAHIARQYRRNGGEINFSDDELAYLSYAPLLRYERDSAMRDGWIDSLKYTWKQVQPDRNPLWNYISASSGAGQLTTSLMEDSRKTLERIPYELVTWSTRNSHRMDVEFRTDPDRFGLRQITVALSPDERGQLRWNSNPYIPDTSGGGHSEEDGGFFLLPYWMGRYHGWLR